MSVNRLLLGDNLLLSSCRQSIGVYPPGPSYRQSVSRYPVVKPPIARPPLTTCGGDGEGDCRGAGMTKEEIAGMTHSLIIMHYALHKET